MPENYRIHTCSVVPWTKLLVIRAIRQYILSLKTDRPRVILVTGYMDGPSDQYSFNGVSYTVNASVTVK